MLIKKCSKFFFCGLVFVFFLSCCASNTKITRYNWDKIERKKQEAESEKSINTTLIEAKKVVYYDENYPTSWVYYPEVLVKFLESKGFVVLNADELKEWMENKISVKAAGSVCVMSMGIAPKELVEPRNRNCILFKYINAGGRIVWIGDYPLWYLGTKGGFTQEFDSEVAWNVLGVYGYRLIDVDKWSKIELKVPARAAAISESGKEWGMEVLDNSHTFFGSENVTTIFSDVHPLWCCSWFKNYNYSYKYSGFIRYRATTYDARDKNINNDLYRIAIYNLE